MFELLLKAVNEFGLPKTLIDEPMFFPCTEIETGFIELTHCPDGGYHVGCVSPILS
jgi:hypothetical protein